MLHRTTQVAATLRSQGLEVVAGVPGAGVLAVSAPGVAADSSDADSSTRSSRRALQAHLLAVKGVLTAQPDLKSRLLTPFGGIGNPAKGRRWHRPPGGLAPVSSRRNPSTRLGAAVAALSNSLADSRRRLLAPNATAPVCDSRWGSPSESEEVPYHVQQVGAREPFVIDISKTRRDKLLYCLLDTGMVSALIPNKY
jgi:hypothetical protein